jgi:tRNA (Thr-GGU) A37 N-methylase
MRICESTDVPCAGVKMQVDSSTPTRATLRRDLEQSIPAGQEAEVFLAASAEVDEAVARLRDLREARVALAKRASEHRRKLHDWKGKIPREQGAPAPDISISAKGVMPCVTVATIVRPPRAARSRGEGALLFLPRYKRALDGVQRFSKLWVVVLSRGDVIFSQATGERPAVCQHPGWAAAEGMRVHLVLVDIVERRGPNAVDKDMLVVNGLNSEAIIAQTGETFVIDIKPYLAYCEAFPNPQEQEQHTLLAPSTPSSKDSPVPTDTSDT